MKNLINLDDIKIIDLTHTLSPDIPQWNIGCGFQSHIKSDYSDSKGEVKFKVHQLEMSAGIGTHIDAPLHCFHYGKSIADIPLENLVAQCVVIDLSSKTHEKYTVSSDEIKAFENHYGLIPENSFVIIYTGWGKYWSTPEKYRNNLIFPSISKEAAEILLKRNIVGLGIDTLSPDRDGSHFPVHQIILGAGKYIVENIANANQLPAVGSIVIALPLKIKEGTEAPMRLVGIKPLN